MCITISAIESYMDIPDYMTAEEIRTAKLDDDHQGTTVILIIQRWDCNHR